MCYLIFYLTLSRLYWLGVSYSLALVNLSFSSISLLTLYVYVGVLFKSLKWHYFTWNYDWPLITHCIVSLSSKCLSRLEFYDSIGLLCASSISHALFMLAYHMIEHLVCVRWGVRMYQYIARWYALSWSWHSMLPWHEKKMHNSLTSCY